MIEKKIIYTALILPIILFIFSSKVFADAFYASGGDISYCTLSFALAVGYTNLTPEYTNSSNGGISYNQSLVNGINDNTFVTEKSFSDFATDVFPNAQRFNINGTNISIPPGTTINIYGLFKNANPYALDMLPGGVLFTSLSDPTTGDIGNLDQDQSNAKTNRTMIVIYQGRRYVRSGYGINVGNLGTINANQTENLDLYDFTAITPITATRTMAYSFDTFGNLIVSFSLDVKNNSVYEEDGVSIKDQNFQKTIDMLPMSDQVFSYSINLGTTYTSSLFFPSAQISDPNFHTEIFQQGESSYESNPDGVSMVIPRNDEEAPASWVGFQSTLPLLDTSSSMSITLIPYTFYTSTNSLSISPQVNLHKTQNGTDGDINVSIGDKINYSITLTNSGNAPASNIFVTDNIPFNFNITDPGTGTVCLDNGSNINGFVCHNEIEWSIPYLGIGAQTTLSFSGVVANTAFYQEDISNYAIEQNNSSFVSRSNTVNANLINSNVLGASTISPIEIDLASSNSINLGSILGVVWNDVNINGIYEADEHSIPNAEIDYAYDNVRSRIFTNSSGRYEIDGLPFDTPISINILKPNEYSHSSTYSSYVIVFSKSVSNTTYTINKDTVYVTSGSYFNQADLGVYNFELADTGENISYVYFFALILTTYSIYKLFVER